MNNVEEQLSNITIKDILGKYDQKTKENIINIIIKNFDLRNSSNRKNKIKFEDIIREIFADGLIEKDFENRKIEKTIKSMESIIP